MKFGVCPVRDAMGGILAHSMTVGGQKFRKGTVLTADHIAALAAAGVDRVTVATLGSDDLGEDVAARSVGAVLSGPGLTPAPPVHGRVDLVADAAGLLCVDANLIDAANGMEEGIAIATLPPFAVVSAGQRVATIKIIPYGIGAAVVAEIEQGLRGRDPLKVAPFRPGNIGLISTLTPGFKGALVDKTRAVLAARIEPLGSRIVFADQCTHHADDLATMIGAAFDQEIDFLLIMGGAAITDRRDVVPVALEAAGGTVTRLGMPVEPGNLMLLGAMGDKPVIGLPGCVRSPVRNGVDWVLERLCAGIEVRAQDIVRMGVGGYLKGLEDV